MKRYRVKIPPQTWRAAIGTPIEDIEDRIVLELQLAQGLKPKQRLRRKADRRGRKKTARVSPESPSIRLSFTPEIGQGLELYCAHRNVNTKTYLTYLVSRMFLTKAPDPVSAYLSKVQTSAYKPGITKTEARQLAENIFVPEYQREWARSYAYRTSPRKEFSL